MSVRCPAIGGGAPVSLAVRARMAGPFFDRRVMIFVMVLLCLAAGLYAYFSRMLATEEAQCREKCIALGHTQFRYSPPAVRMPARPSSCSCGVELRLRHATSAGAP